MILTSSSPTRVSNRRLGRTWLSSALSTFPTGRDQLAGSGMTNSTIRRKLTALRSLFSYLKTYGYTGPNPAHSDFVAAPAVARDGKTVALSTYDCRRLLDAPLVEDVTIKDPAKRSIPAGIRDRAMLAVLAYSGCRVGELVRLRIRDYKTR